MVNGATPEDNAVALQGQAKHVVYQAYKELDSRLGPLGGAGPEVSALVNSTWFHDPSHDQLPIQISQLKYLAKPFYDRLHTVGLYTTAFVTGDTAYYPWTEMQEDDADQAPANLGQLKFAFSFELDTDADDLQDFFEQPIVDAVAEEALTHIEDVIPGDDFD